MRLDDLQTKDPSSVVRAAVYGLIFLITARFFYDLFAIEILIELNLWAWLLEFVFWGIAALSVVVPLFYLGRLKHRRQQLWVLYAAVVWCVVFFAYPSRVEFFLHRNERALRQEVQELRESGERFKHSSRLGRHAQVFDDPFRVYWQHTGWGLGDRGLLWDPSHTFLKDQSARDAYGILSVHHVHGPWFLIGRT